MKMFALLTDAGLAIPHTAICEEHKDSLAGQSIAIGNADQWAPDWDGSEVLMECTDDHNLHCQICDKSS